MARRKMTFKRIYDTYKNEAVRKPTPAQEFIKEVAQLTHCSEVTVRAWVYNPAHQPDKLTQSVLAQHFGIPEAELFPPQNKKLKKQNP